ncbi:MAG: 30S ribosomal protein S12 methylthiotransferase RimO [Deltaproteobacteria bacterium]|nr:30S ribosomal protein S12 methylthiotransferase RimO [Deltaproteobacteria bacterium]
MIDNPLAVHVISLGCPKNRVDTEFLLGALGPIRLVPSPHEADLILVNTCAFIQPAVEESLSTIMDLSQDLVDLSPRPVLAVVGCLVDRYRQELQADLAEADILLPIRNYASWPHVLNRTLGRTQIQPLPSARLLEPPLGSAYLKIAEGCDNSCAFCTIPSIRGRLRSRTVSSLVNESRMLLDQGAREIVLVAQDLTAYGRDLGPDNTLPCLIDGLQSLPGLEWIRLMYLYPSGLDRELLDFLAGCGPTLLPYFDIPFQHSHPDILKGMGRPFRTDPRAVVERIRSRFPDAALRTTLITGYPGEKPSHFKDLLRFVEETKFHHVGVFPFWPEQGTRAAELPDQVGPRTKNRRRDEIMALQAEISASILAPLEGQIIEVLVDRIQGEWPGLHVGRTWFQAPEVDGVVYVSGPGVQPGTMIKAMVEEAQTYDLVALAGEG